MFEKYLSLRIFSYIFAMFACFIVTSVLTMESWYYQIWAPFILSIPIAWLGTSEYVEMTGDRYKKPVIKCLRQFSSMGIFIGPIAVALIIPVAWYFNGMHPSLEHFYDPVQYSFWEDLAGCMFYVIFFGIPTLEGIVLNNIYSDKDHRIPLWKPVFLYLSVPVGLLAIKYICLWLTNYSSVNGVATFFLIVCLTVVPIGFLFLMYWVYFFARQEIL